MRKLLDVSGFDVGLRVHIGSRRKGNAHGVDNLLLDVFRQGDVVLVHLVIAMSLGARSLGVGLIVRDLLSFFFCGGHGVHFRAPVLVADGE